MTVKELIEKLKTMPQEREVLVAGYTSYDKPTGVIVDLIDGYETVVVTTD